MGAGPSTRRCARLPSVGCTVPSSYRTRYLVISPLEGLLFLRPNILAIFRFRFQPVARKTQRVLSSFAQARIQDKYQRQEVSSTEVGDNDIVAGQTLVPAMPLYIFAKRQTRSLKLLGTMSP